MDLYHRGHQPDDENAVADKALPDGNHLLLSVLLCPAYQFELFKKGAHLEAIGFRMRLVGRKGLDLIQQNQNPRFHYLAGWGPLQVAKMVVDFKHYFCVSPESLQVASKGRKHYIARLACLYREDLSHRFAAYLARIGLPVPHHYVGVSEAAESEA